MKSALTSWAGLLGVVLLLAGTGCVEVHQTIYMQHDGSGKITEKIRVMPRAVRLLKGRKIRSGQAEDSFAILAETTVQNRMKASGDLTLVGKPKLTTLKDGSIQMNVTYTFKSINQVKLWVAPTFKCNDPTYTGKMSFNFKKVIYNRSSKKYFKADATSVSVGRHGAPARKKYSSPSALKDFEHITPVFQDMLSGFILKIEVVAPMEDFETPGMVNNAPRHGNRVTLLDLKGENVAGSKTIIKQFLAGEVGGRADAWGGTWKKMEDGLPNTYTPYAKGYGGIGFRFLKLAETAGPSKGAKKKKKK